MAETEPIPRDTLDAVSRYTRFHILAELNRAFAMSGLSIEQLASRLGWRPVEVRKFLSGRTKTKIELVGETAFAIDGSLVSFSLAPTPRQERKMSEWLDHDGLRDPLHPGDTRVEVKFRDGDTGKGVVHDWDQNWQWQGTEAGRRAAGAIVAYAPS